MAAPVSRERLRFAAGDTLALNTARKQWRREATATELPSSGRRVATVLADYLSFEHGYCWPSNEELASEIRASTRTVENGIAALDKAGLIERQTRVKRDEKGEAIGKERRIYLTRPEVNHTISPEVNHTVEVNHIAEKVNHMPRGEPHTGGGNKRDSYTPAYEDKALPHAYVRAHTGARVSEIPSFPNRLSAGVWLGDFLFPGDGIFDQCVDAAVSGTLTLEVLARAQGASYPDMAGSRSRNNAERTAA